MREHEKNALAIARLLEGSSEVVSRVAYPGLASHPQHELARRQMTGFGGMITFWLRDDSLEAARAFLGALKLFALAESLGGVESLAEHPGLMTHASVPAAQRKELGISDGMIRLSVGVEAIEDLEAEIAGALAAASKR